MPRLRHVFMLALAVLLLVAPAARAASSDMVIGQVFAGGGNSNAPYSNDFVELFNRGSTSVDLAGWSLQYATGAGTSWQVTPLSGSVPPGGRYLVQLASAAAVGSPLPAPDATGTSNLAVSGGKVALVRSITPLGCGAAAGSCAGDASIADLIGYGSAADYEGSGPAPAISNTTAAMRAADGCTDTDSSSSDFSSGAPTPRNSASAVAPCGAAPPPADGVSTGAGVDIDIQPVLSIALERPTISFGHAVSGETPASVSERVTVASNRTSGYALTVHRSAFLPSDLPLGLSATAPSGGQLGGQLSGGMAPIPIAPTPDLLIGTTSAPSAAAGDAWATSVGFTSPLPMVASGHYSATVTFTVIGR